MILLRVSGKNELNILAHIANQEKRKDKRAIKLPKLCTGPPVSQWFKCWPTGLTDRVRALLEAISSEP